jgi:hypothetical protein
LHGSLQAAGHHHNRNIDINLKLEYWSGGVMEYWGGGVLEWWSGGVMEWWSDGVLDKADLNDLKWQHH